MKNNHNMHGKKVFFKIPLFIILFVALLFPASMTLGKYSTSLALDLAAEVLLEPDVLNGEKSSTANNPTDTGNTPGIEDETPTTVYQVQPGDTLVSIAEKFHITVEALAAYNHLNNDDSLQVGMILHIPPMDYVVS